MKQIWWASVRRWHWVTPWPRHRFSSRKCFIPFCTLKKTIMLRSITLKSASLSLSRRDWTQSSLIFSTGLSHCGLVLNLSSAGFCVCCSACQNTMLLQHCVFLYLSYSATDTYRKWCFLFIASYVFLFYFIFLSITLYMRISVNSRCESKWKSSHTNYALWKLLQVSVSQ